MEGHYKNNVHNTKDHLAELVVNIKYRDVTKVNHTLDLLCSNGEQESLSAYRGANEETLLHIAVMYSENADVVSRLVKLCPQLLLRARDSSDNYRGQTALHIALAKGNKDATETILRAAKENNCLPNLLQGRATGDKFINTVMMGELPLAVAALKLEPDLVELLLEYGAELHMQNSHGDSILHSLIKYSAIYPEKLQEVKHMFGSINSKIEGSGETDRLACNQNEDVYPHMYSYLWLLQNNDHLTPLQLAAKLEISELFEFILNIKDVYCFESAHDGLFDVKMYDITEIENGTNRKSDLSYSSANIHKIVPSWTADNLEKSMDTGSNEYHGTNDVETGSILEMLFPSDFESKGALRIVELLPIKKIVQLKWFKYRALFITWMVAHYFSMACMTMYSTERSGYFYHVNEKNHTHLPRKMSILITRWAFLCLGLLYGTIFAFIAITKFKRRHILKHVTHNLEFSIALGIFSLCIVVDTIRTLVQETHNSIALTFALFCGYWFNIFFLRAFKKFSFYIMMIKQVIVGDMVRYGLIYFFALTVFAAAMFIQLNNVPFASDYQKYQDTMLEMFKVGIGMAEIKGALFMAWEPWLAVLVFIMFLIVTYIMMLSALVAMMSQTCALVLEDRNSRWLLQRLSVVLFLEDILHFFCLSRFLSSLGEPKHMVGFDPVTKKMKKQTRYFLEFHPSEMELAPAEDKNIVKRRKTSPPYSSV